MTGESYISITNLTSGRTFRGGVNLNSSANNYYYGTVVANFTLTKGDQVVVRVRQNSGSSHPLAPSEFLTYFTGYAIAS